jgi:hypothetical protein
MNISDAKIDKLFIHYVGNKVREEGLKKSKKKINIEDDDIHNKLRDFYVVPFLKTFDFYTFYHASALKFNEVYNYVASIFEDASSVSKISLDIAEHLYENSVHPKISGGELHVIYLKGCELDGKIMDAIGIFKTETKVNFLKLNTVDNGYSIHFEEGINPSDGFDKGCLIFNTGKREGYKLCVIDNKNNSQEAQYWKDNFLKVKSYANEYSNTKNYLNVCKEYVSKQLPEEFEVTKTDQIDLLNRSLAYFKENEDFDEKEFTKTVLVNSEIIKSFKSFKTDFIERNEIEIEEQFEVSSPAVKRQSKNFKSVLKLDKNFHIYIHGDKDLIEKGVEKNGRKYYKIYYDEEQ